jgi:hypothetical protein
MDSLKQTLLHTPSRALVLFTFGSAALARIVTQWNLAFENSLFVGGGRVGSQVPTRALAIMHIAMFDAVNGVQRKYESCFVTDSAPPGARAEAAAIQAAYTTLSALSPAHQAAYDTQLQASLEALAVYEKNRESIARGRAWGEFVANAILAWRANDGFTAELPPPRETPKRERISRRILSNLSG